MNPLRIDHNIIPEDVIRQLQLTHPLVISARVFESVVAELLETQIELKEQVEELRNELDSRPTQEELNASEEEKEELDSEYTRFKTNLATFLSNNSDTVDFEIVQSYFDDPKIDICEMIDEYSE